MTNSIKFDQPTVDRLKAAYTEAVEAEVGFFSFDGHKIVTQYAKYMLEYLGTKGFKV